MGDTQAVDDDDLVAKIAAATRVNFFQACGRDPDCGAVIGEKKHDVRCNREG